MHDRDLPIPLSDEQLVPVPSEPYLPQSNPSRSGTDIVIAPPRLPARPRVIEDRTESSPTIEAFALDFFPEPWTHDLVMTMLREGERLHYLTLADEYGDWRYECYGVYPLIPLILCLYKDQLLIEAKVIGGNRRHLNRIHTRQRRIIDVCKAAGLTHDHFTLATMRASNTPEQETEIQGILARMGIPSTPKQVTMTAQLARGMYFLNHGLAYGALLTTRYP